MKPAAKLSLQFLILGLLFFAASVIGSAMGWLKYVPDPLQLPDGGMVQIFRTTDAGEVEEAPDAGEHDVTPELESERDAGILSHDSEVHTR